MTYGVKTTISAATRPVFEPSRYCAAKSNTMPSTKSGRSLLKIELAPDLNRINHEPVRPYVPAVRRYGPYSQAFSGITGQETAKSQAEASPMALTNKKLDAMRRLFN
ncbi:MULTISPECIES: hypothetical protein [unclassified Endozoicomonas]|uniref:hypothetical protein n=1 Tax=unclassified Endozoicomonas TaxID=2644528 RepID=UPI002148F990|nr:MULTISPECIES: hypothetical protein [unclassified Endozoicomonas]